MSDATETLRRVELFGRLDDPQLGRLAADAREQTFGPNALLMREGERGDSMYVLTEGSVKVFVAGEGGRELVLNRLGPGAAIGDVALLDDAPRSASVATLEPSKALVIGKPALLDSLREDPEIALGIIRSLTALLRRATEGNRSLAFDDVYRRLTAKLRELAEKDADGTPVLPERLSQRELGNLIGASREMVGKIMAELVKGGYVELREGRIALLRRLPQDW